MQAIQKGLVRLLQVHTSTQMKLWHCNWMADSALFTGWVQCCSHHLHCFHYFLWWSQMLKSKIHIVASNHQRWGCTPPPSKVKAGLDFPQPINRCRPLRNSKELCTFTTASFPKFLLSGTCYMRLWKRDSVFMVAKTALANATMLSHLLPWLQIATDHTVIAFCSCAHVLLHVHINIY